MHIRWSRTGLVATAALAAAAAAAVLRAPPAAQAGDLNPPLVGMHEIQDKQGYVSLEVPARTKDDGPDPSHPNGLAHLGLILHDEKPNDRPEAFAWLDYQAGYSFAGLRRAVVESDLPGAEDEAFHRIEEGLWEEVRKDTAANTAFLFRWIERDDRVLMLTFSAPISVLPSFRPHFEHIASTLKIVKPLPEITWADGLVASVADGRAVLTDKKDRKAAKSVLASHLTGWKQAAALLGTERVWKGPPTIVVSDAAVVAKNVGGLAVNGPLLDEFSRAIVCTTRQAQDGKLNGDNVERLAVVQYVRGYFGGHSARWLDVGLTQWAFAATKFGGKPQKVPASELKKLRTAVEELDSGMPGLWHVTTPTDDDDLQVQVYVLWAWQLFFRHADEAKPWADTYAKTIDLIRTQGDLRGAEKLWEDVDAEALKQAFRGWLASWKP